MNGFFWKMYVHREKTAMYITAYTWHINIVNLPMPSLKNNHFFSFFEQQYSAHRQLFLSLLGPNGADIGLYFLLCLWSMEFFSIVKKNNKWKRQNEREREKKMGERRMRMWRFVHTGTEWMALCAWWKCALFEGIKPNWPLCLAHMTRPFFCVHSLALAMDGNSSYTVYMYIYTYKAYIGPWKIHPTQWDVIASSHGFLESALNKSTRPPFVSPFSVVCPHCTLLPRRRPSSIFPSSATQGRDNNAPSVHQYTVFLIYGIVYIPFHLILSFSVRLFFFHSV